MKLQTQYSTLLFTDIVYSTTDSKYVHDNDIHAHCAMRTFLDETNFNSRKSVYVERHHIHLLWWAVDDTATIWAFGQLGDIQSYIDEINSNEGIDYL